MIGQVQDKYLFQEPGGDQLCGRTVCGLPRISSTIEFDILPPHFNVEASRLLNGTFWNGILNGYDRYPSGFKRALPYFLASLLYHHDYLRSVFQPSHPIFLSPVFTRNVYLKDLKKGILLGYGACHVTGNYL